jgi:hypothetical protein
LEKCFASIFKVANNDLGGCRNKLKVNMCLLNGKVARIVARLIILKMEAAGSSEMLKQAYYLTQYNNPKVIFF